MNAGIPSRVRVLFVDDDEAFLQMVGQGFADFSKGAWELFLASNTNKALQTLREKSVDLAVLDVQMAGASGLQFSKMLKREYPSLPKVVLTSLTDDQTRAAALEAGASLMLEKPGRLAEMGAIYATLSEFLKLRLRQGVQSVPTPFGLLDLVKMECKAGNSRLFEVTGGGAQGQIFVKGGQIIHAHTEGRRGQSAFCHLACLPGVEFSLRRYVEPAEQSIDRQWEFLVLEALHLQEEMAEAAARAEAAQAAGAGAGGATEASGGAKPAASAPAPTGVPSSTSATPPWAAARDTETPTPAPAARPTETPGLRMAGAPGGVVRGGVAGAPARKSADQAIAKLPGGRKLQPLLDTASVNVEEIVVGSAENALLYEWQCENCQERLRFMALTARAVREVNELLRGGTPDRVEFLASEGRMVFLPRPDRCVLIRSSSRFAQPAVRSSPADLRASVWVSSTPRFPGILSLTTGRVDRILASRQFAGEAGDRTEERLWKCLQELSRAVAQVWRSCWQVRVLLERSQAYFIRRPDGATLLAVLVRDSAELDEARWESLVGEFEGLRME